MKMCLIVLFLCPLLFSCGKEQGDILSVNSSSENTLTPVQIITLGGDTNHRGVTLYDENGSFLSAFNFRAEGATPRNLVQWSEDSVLISLDVTDSVYELSFDGTKNLFHGSNQLNGNIYGIAVDSQSFVYVVESNRIEVFDSNGNRDGSKLINTTVGGCTLSNPRGIFMNSSDQLYVLNQGGADNLLIYDVSGSAATCVSSQAIGNNPYSLVMHSNGYLYITTQADDRVYRADLDGSNLQVVWDTDTSLINNPTGIAELPNGDLIVASSQTDSVERITTSGVRVGNSPFIEDSLSLNLQDIIVVGGSDAQ